MVGIIYGVDKGRDLTIRGYFDFDWAGDHTTKKSTSGIIFMLNGCPVNWYSKTQAMVALSSTEAEYVALTLATKEATWIRLLFTEVGLLNENDQYVIIKVTENLGTK